MRHSNLILALAFLLFGHAVHASTREYIFIDIWEEYTTPTELPAPLAPRQFLQPDINIDDASLAQFKAQHPAFSSLEIDTNNRLLLAFGVRQTPVRVIVDDGKVIKKERLNKRVTPTIDAVQTYPLQTLSGQPFTLENHITDYRVLFFSDSLCPFQHIPDCETRIAQNNLLAATITYPVITVIKPFYVDKQSAIDYQQRFAVKQDIVFDHHNEVFQHFAIHELPYWLVQDNQGKVIYRGNQPPNLL